MDWRDWALWAKMQIRKSTLYSNQSTAVNSSYFMLFLKRQDMVLFRRLHNRSKIFPIFHVNTDADHDRHLWEDGSQRESKLLGQWATFVELHVNNWWRLINWHASDSPLRRLCVSSLADCLMHPFFFLFFSTLVGHDALGWTPHTHTHALWASVGTVC